MAKVKLICSSSERLRLLRSSVVYQERHSSFSKWLMKQRLSMSATSTTGMAKVKLICSSSETSAMLLAWTSPIRPVFGQGQTDEEGKKFAKYDDVVEEVK